jgi:hypothetical protein
MQDESRGEVPQADRDVNGLQAAEAEPHGRGRRGDSQPLTDPRDRRDELCGCELADVRQAVAGTREDQRTIAQVGVEIRTQRRGRRGVTAGEEQDNLALARGERHLHRAGTGLHDARPHASILACSLVSVAGNTPARGHRMIVSRDGQAYQAGHAEPQQQGVAPGSAPGAKNRPELADLCSMRRWRPLT